MLSCTFHVGTERFCRRFASIHDPVASLLYIRTPRYSIQPSPRTENRSMQLWNEVAHLQAAQAKAVGEIFWPEMANVAVPSWQMLGSR
jgi:hypothetical protein